MSRPNESGAATSTQRRYVEVAHGILSSINAGEYEAGHRLPADRDLAAAKGVSRQTIREALLVLELIGAVSIRHGDGVFVSPPSTPQVNPGDAILFGDPRDVIESRRYLEPITTRLAAERITPTQLETLRTLLPKLEGRRGQPAADSMAVGLQFHAELAAACGNSMMSDVVAQLVAIENHPLWRLVNEQALRVPGARESQRSEHREILDAVAAGDADLAEALMRSHLDELESYIFAPSLALTLASDMSLPTELDGL